MKNLTLIIAMAAMVFGLNPNIVQASEKNVVASEMVRSVATATYDKETESILVNMRTDELERVLIQVTDGSGNLVFAEHVTVNSRGFEMKISLHGLAAGTYNIKLRGDTIATGHQFKKK